MAKEINVTLTSLKSGWCELPGQTMDVLLKLEQRLGSIHLEKM